MEWKCLMWIFPLLFLDDILCATIKSYGLLGKQKEIISLVKRIHTGSFNDCHHYFDELDLHIGDDEIFTVFNGDHSADAMKLYEFLIAAKSYEDFYSRSAWARCRVNAGLFVYAFSVAVLRSEYTKDVLLPNFYETNPFYFVGKDVIDKAIEAEENNTIIDVNVDTKSIKYFTEDVGVSSYYYFLNLLLPFWMETNNYPLSNENGELYLHLLQQLLARYNLERYALGLENIPSYDYEHPIKLGYDCDLMYPNGELFPSRKDNEEILYRDVLEVEVTNNTNANAYTYVKDFELKLRQLMDESNNLHLSTIVNEMGFIGSSRTDSRKFNYARILLGNPSGKSKTPSALEHYETSTRDPIFWAMLKRSMYYYYKYNNLKNQPRVCVNYYNYNYNERMCEKFVTVSNFEISKLETYFEDYIIDLNNAINKDNFNVQARMKRLNHIPFFYKIGLRANSPTSVLVKLFIGPKNDQIKNNRFNFVEIDRFICKLENDLKIFQRYLPSDLYSNDRETFTDFYNGVIDSFILGEDYGLSDSVKYYGFPNRLMLPQGSPTGTTFQLYVVALPVPSDKFRIKIMLSNAFDFNHPLISSYEGVMSGPNSFSKDVLIFHNTNFTEQNDKI